MMRSGREVDMDYAAISDNARHWDLPLLRKVNARDQDIDLLPETDEWFTVSMTAVDTTDDLASLIWCLETGSTFTGTAEDAAKFYEGRKCLDAVHRTQPLCADPRHSSAFYGYVQMVNRPRKPGTRQVIPLMLEHRCPDRLRDPRLNGENYCTHSAQDFLEHVALEHDVRSSRFAGSVFGPRLGIMVRRSIAERLVDAAPADLVSKTLVFGNPAFMPKGPVVR